MEVIPAVTMTRFPIIILLLLLLVVPHSQGVRSLDEGEASPPVSSGSDAQSSLRPGSPYQVSRYWGGGCTNSDLVVQQGPTHPLPSGIPTYTVTVLNSCSSGCDIHGIHLSCGWFSSARLIDPSIFRRLCYDDCLVYNGKTLPNGHAISFQYANTFPYRLYVSSISCRDPLP